jgi:hypothetical protein
LELEVHNGKTGCYASFGSNANQIVAFCSCELRHQMLV